MGSWLSLRIKMKHDIYLTSYTIEISGVFVGLNVRGKIIKLPEGNIRGSIFLNVGKKFFKHKLLCIKENINKSDQIIIKKFYFSTDSINRVKRQAIEIIYLHQLKLTKGLYPKHVKNSYQKKT